MCKRNNNYTVARKIVIFFVTSYNNLLRTLSVNLKSHRDASISSKKFKEDVSFINKKNKKS